MKSITKQGIAQSLREGLTAYLSDGENAFIQESAGGISPTDDAISYLKNWIECEFDNNEDPDKGTIAEWKEICIPEFIDYLELSAGNFDDETMYDYLVKELS